MSVNLFYEYNFPSLVLLRFLRIKSDSRVNINKNTLVLTLIVLFMEYSHIHLFTIRLTLLLVVLSFICSGEVSPKNSFL